MSGKQAATPKAQESYEVAPAVLADPAVGIDRPELLVRMLVIESLRTHKKFTGREPKVIHLPVALEAALQVDLGRNLNVHRKLREQDALFGCLVAWDAKAFRVE